MPDNLPKARKLKIVVIIISIALFFSFCSIIYVAAKAYVIRKAEKEIQAVLLHHRGIHHYIQRNMLPELHRLKEAGEIPHSFYTPVLFSSSYMVRNIHIYNNEELKKAGMDQLYYKMAADNPRNPVNKTDLKEQEILQIFNKNRDLLEYREIIKIDGKSYLQLALPFLPTTRACLECHGKREDAPAQLQARYKGMGGYGDKIGNIRGIESIRIPLDNRLSIVNIVIISIIIIAFGFLILVGFNYRLRSMVSGQTDKLRKSEEKYQILVKNANDAIFVAQDGIVKFPNQKNEELTGYSAEELINIPFVDLIHPDDRAKVIERHKKRLMGEKPISTYTFRIINKSGLEKTVQLNTTAIQWEERPATLNYLKDITQQTKIERQLQQAQKMESIGTLAGGIAHDFNNILFPILGYTEMLLEDIDKESQHRASLEEIYTGALRARDLVKQILAFSRQESSELRLMKMQPIIKEALKLIRSSVPTTIDIKQDIHTECGVIKADPTQIHQIIMNLTTNAYHAMEKTGGEMKIILEEIKLGEQDVAILNIEPGTYACLAVSDTGIGMDRDLIKKIFDPFFTTKDKGKGTGMGLSVVHGIVIGMGGAVKVYSDPDKGTEFKVYFPIEKSSFPKQNIQTSELIQGGDEHILLVDDEMGIITMEKQMLERLGYQITSRTSSIEALEAFRTASDKFDLVITDMAMPNMTGEKLSAELIKIRPDIPILLCTGFSESMPEEKATSLGIKGFLMKPVVMRDLSLKVREVLDKKD